MKEVRLREIKGLMGEKFDVERELDYPNGIKTGRNLEKHELGEKKVGLDVEKVAQIVYETYTEIDEEALKWNNISEIEKSFWKCIAITLSSRISEVLKVKENK